MTTSPTESGRAPGTDAPATRVATTEDRPAQAALFDRCFGRDDGAAVLPWRYDDGPHGASLGRVVDGEGGLVASYACSPRVLRMGSDEVVVGQTGDVMTDPGARGRGLFSALDRAVLDDARAAGWPVVYGLPNSSSAHIFTRDLDWLEVGRVRPWTFVLAPDARARSERFRAGRLARAAVPWAYWRGTMRVGKMKDLFFEKANVVAIARFKEEVDAVASAAHPDAPWAVRRDHAYLNWRFVDAPSGRFKAHGVYDAEGELRGYAVVQVPARGEAVGYVVDLLALDRVALAAGMEAALSHLRKAGASVARATAVAGSRWEAELRWAGFRAPKAEDAKPVIVRVLDEGHPAAAVARRPQDWWFTDADRDAELLT